ncbi:hypothetical protein [Thalassotalea montiporae]
MFNKVAGLAIGITFFLIYSGNVDWFSSFNTSVEEALSTNPNYSYYTGRAGFSAGGVIYLYIPVILSVFFLVFPSLSSQLFSPKDNYGKPILSKDFWCIPGYLLALVGWGLLYVYE